MYKNPFFIKNPVGNNIFSFEKRKIKQIFVPNLIKINNINDIKIGTKIAFSDFDFDGNLIEAVGLKNFYEFNYKNKKIYLFDNHNHSFYFWFLEKNLQNLGQNNILFHIDQHSDMKDDGHFLSLEECSNMQKVFEFTNFTLNVGNYIKPAIENGFIKEVFQIRNQTNIDDFFVNKKELFKKYSGKILLNLDLDFFDKSLDYLDFEERKKIILEIFENSQIITICTSPFFIDQKLALKIFKDIFN